MSKDTANINDLTSKDAGMAGPSSSDLYNSYINAPVSKLDADEYLARDLDGVTESLLGSGNLNFLMMQAAQTNESISSSNPFSSGGESHNFSPSSFASGGISTSPAFADNSFDVRPERGVDRLEPASGSSESGPVNGSSGTAGVLSASTLAANSSTVSPFADSSSLSSSAVSTAEALPGLPGNNGNSGTDGTDGTPGGGNTTIINNDITIINEDIFESVENIYNDTTNLLTEITNNAGDVITTTINNAGDLLTTVVNNAGDIITTTVNNAGDLLTTIVNNAGDITTTTINNAGDVINNLINNITNGDGLGPVGLNLDATLDGLTHLNLDIINGTNIVNVLNETLDTSPILNPVSDLLGSIVSDTSLDVLLNPFQYDNSANDVDLHLGTDLDILGIQVPDLALDIPLDPVEALLGDLDINLDLTNALLNDIPLLGGLGGGGGNNDTDLSLDTGISLLDHALPLPPLDLVLNPIENLTGDVDIAGDIGLGLLGTADAGDTGADITIPLDLDLLDNNLLNENIGISLDPLEQIIGDVDIDLPVAIDLLGDSADSLIDGFNGGMGGEDLLTGVNDLLTNILDPLLPFDGSGSDTDIVSNIGADLLGGNLLDSATDINIDPIEQITQDLDLDLAGGLDILPGLAVPDLESLPDLILQGPDGDITDLTGISDIAELDIAGDLSSTLLGDHGNLLDGVLNLIDHTVDTAINLLDSAAPLVGGLDLGAIAGGGGADDLGSTLGTWTENILPDAGSVLGGGINETVETVMADPIAVIAPLISVPVPSLPLPGLGGLFGGGGHGGGHHGGLFG